MGGTASSLMDGKPPIVTQSEGRTACELCGVKLEADKAHDCPKKEKHFKVHAEWVDEGRKRGLQGPYLLPGGGEHFVNPIGGVSAGMWYHDSEHGVINAEPAA